MTHGKCVKLGNFAKNDTYFGRYCRCSPLFSLSLCHVARIENSYPKFPLSFSHPKSIFRTNLPIICIKSKGRAKTQDGNLLKNLSLVRSNSSAFLCCLFTVHWESTKLSHGTQFRFVCFSILCDWLTARTNFAHWHWHWRRRHHEIVAIARLAMWFSNELFNFHFTWNGRTRGSDKTMIRHLYRRHLENNLLH